MGLMRHCKYHTNLYNISTDFISIKPIGLFKHGIWQGGAEFSLSCFVKNNLWPNPIESIQQWIGRSIAVIIPLIVL